MKKRWALLLSLLLLLLSSVSARAESWKPTRVGPPEARSSHTAVWTGTRMIIWGGWSGSSCLNTGGRYNPSTNSWTPTSTTGAPAGRYNHTALWTGSQMIVWGGYDGGGHLRTGGRYTP